MVYKRLFDANNRIKEFEYRKKFSIHPSVQLNYPDNIWLKGNISIGSESYINGGRLISGQNTKIVIGMWCAIGHNVNIISVTHDIIFSTGPENERPLKEKDIIIGNHVWIGSNVFIREGVIIGDNAIIGANSLVICDVPENAIFGGVPAKLIKFKDSK